MANNLLTNDIILRTALMEFDNNLIFAKTARRDYQDKYDPTTGNTIRIRKPTRYIVREGKTIQIQDINSQNTDMVIAYQDGVDIAVTSEQLALQLDDFNREVLNPAMVTLANKVDTRLYDTTIDIYNNVGVAGTAPASFAVMNNAAARLDSFGVQRDNNRFALLKTFDSASLQSSLYNTFNENFNKDIILRGSMGNLAGFDVYSVQNPIRPLFSSLDTDGAQPVSVLGTPLVNGASQTGSTLVCDGFTISTTGIVKAGATFTMAGVNSVNPVSREDTGQLAQFVVTADANSDGSGNVTLSIDPPITLTGPYQTVTAAPANNAALTFNKSHNINIAYHKEAFALSVVKMPVGNNGAYQKNMVNEKAKVSLRMSRQFDIINDRDIIRFDILYGVKCFPDYATRILGS
jgi:hypothetical protein